MCYKIARAIYVAYPDTIRADAKGFFYENADMPPDRFYFDTYEDAAEDLATEMGFYAAEADQILEKVE